MPTLDEYLGGIFNSIAAARTMADIQTVDMAEKYAKHELLKHFAVPHMRIADVEVMIPVAIERAAGREVTELDPIGNAAFKQIILDNIRNIFDPKNLSEEVLAAAGMAIDYGIIILVNDIGKTNREEAVANFADFFYSEMKQILSRSRSRLTGSIGEGLATLRARISEIALSNILSVKSRTVPGELEVIAETHRLRELRPEDIMRIKMIVRENGMEWHSIEKNDGSIERKLLPE